ncbi:MAG: DMT family transporter [Pseudomonadota bacterium]
MHWFFPALASAVAIATVDAVTKRFLSHLTTLEMAAIRLGFGLPFFLGLLLFIPIPPLDAGFFFSVLILLPVEITAYLLYMRAIRVSPLSLTVPFLAFTPVFMILTGRLMLDEQIGLYGVLGVTAVAAGGYVLNLKETRYGWLGPVYAVGREEGSWLMLIVSLLYSFTAVMGKRAIGHSSAAFFGCSYFILLGMIVPGGLLVTRRVAWNSFRRFLLPGISIGALMTIMVLCHMTAISLVKAAYMIAIKRTSILFSVIYAAVLFKEENIGQRFWGASLMLAGVVIIALFG